jgi:site-specific DNA-methyltransferase (adenine-specific)
VGGEVIQIGGATLLQGDALEVLRSLPAGSLDCILTDPPYCSGGVTEAGKGRATHQGLRTEGIRSGRFEWFEGDVMTTPGLVWLLRELGVQAQRLLKSTGHLLIFADWRMVPSLAPAIESAGLRYRTQIIWDKGHMGCGLGFRPRYEPIMHFTGRAPEFHAADVANLIGASRVPTAERANATQKPLKLLRELIRVTTPRGGVICDPFAGSGSMALAAEAEGRHAILVERDATQLEGVRSRLGRHAGTDAPLFAEAAA